MFYLNSFNIPLHSLLASMVSEKFIVILIFSPLQGMYFYRVDSFSIFYLWFLFFWNLYMICLIIYDFWSLSCGAFSKLLISVVWCLTLISGKFSVMIVLNIYFVPLLFFLLVFPLCVCYTFSSYPTDPGHFFFQSLFSLPFSLGVLLLKHPQVQIFPQLCSVY